MRRSFAALLIAAGISASTAFAQTYDISWHTIAGGGGTSSGGSYSVTGTIGQPAAGNLSGGSYSLTGGFWGIISAVQVVGSPLLSIGTSTVANHVVISWSSASTGFVLQQNASLATTNWVNVNTTSFPIVATNGLNTVTFPVGGNEYFRLVSP
ncbi:MAG TPA: hypothetical protein VH413_09170 [Verrucomicrobiae bacterium]|jgi:hypothetical protein|nr:hypothetical protein [Verrucomicrobiae bacterium]